MMYSEHCVKVNRCEHMEPVRDTAGRNILARDTKSFLIPNKSGERRKSWWWWIVALVFIFSNATTKPGRVSPALDLNTAPEMLNSFSEPSGDVQIRCDLAKWTYMTRNLTPTEMS